MSGRQTDKVEENKEWISFIDWLKKMGQTSDSCLSALMDVDLSMSVGRYQTETSLWVPDPSAALWMEGPLTDTHRSTGRTNGEGPFVCRPIRMKECNAVAGVVKRNLTRGGTEVTVGVFVR